MPRVGVFGGSFNPIHFGHLLVAADVVEALDLDRLLLIPAGRPPHKAGADIAPAQHRYAMAALAVGRHPKIAVSDVEIMRDGPSYTVDTLAALQAEGDLHLIIGSETFLDLLAWRDPRGVAKLARLVVVPRSGTRFDPESEAARHVRAELDLPAFVPAREIDTADRRAPLLVPSPSLPISASDLRRRAREGRSLAYRLPEAAIAYIHDHALYGAGSR